MGLAHAYDPFSMSIVKHGFEPQDVTSLVASAEVDRTAIAEGRPQAMQVIVTGECTTAGGALGDAVECIIAVQDSDTSGSGFASFKTFTASLVVDANNGAHQYSVMLPVKLLAANQFVRATVIVQMAAGATGTLSNATAGGELQVGGFTLNAPQPEYDKDGYFEFLV
jgi:hypothetical protein|tara:strand:- start:372 stop:872 length:501 start_codon:yes stop_codon:yes gene_type:complete